MGCPAAPPPPSIVGTQPCYSTDLGTVRVTMAGMDLLTSTLIFTPVSTPDRLRIWQQNLNKSRVVQEDLINSEVYKQFDVLILQEPFIDSYSNTKATCDWRVVYPTSFLSCSHAIHSVILVRSLWTPTAGHRSLSLAPGMWQPSNRGRSGKGYNLQPLY